MEPIIAWAFAHPILTFFIASAVLTTIERVLSRPKRVIHVREQRTFPAAETSDDYQRRRLAADERLLDRAAGVGDDDELNREIAAAAERRTDEYVDDELR